jgi:hypothetical protein
MRSLREASLRQLSLFVLLAFVSVGAVSGLVVGLLHGWRFGVAIALPLGLIAVAVIVIAALITRQRR